MTHRPTVPPMRYPRSSIESSAISTSRILWIRPLKLSNSAAEGGSLTDFTVLELDFAYLVITPCLDQPLHLCPLQLPSVCP